jgi:hypothetical protein
MVPCSGERRRVWFCRHGRWFCLRPRVARRRGAAVDGIVGFGGDNRTHDVVFANDYSRRHDCRALGNERHHDLDD